MLCSLKIDELSFSSSNRANKVECKNKGNQIDTLDISMTATLKEKPWYHKAYRGKPLSQYVKLFSKIGVPCIIVPLVGIYWTMGLWIYLRK